MCLVRDEKTVGALQGVWIGLNLFYAGFVVLPQNFFSFFIAGKLMPVNILTKAPSVSNSGSLCYLFLFLTGRALD